MDEAPSAKPDNSKLRFIDAMPRPMLAVFAVAGIAAVVAALVFIINPPESATIPVQERRPPPRGTVSNDVGKLAPAPLPSELPSLPPPCSAVATPVLEV